MNIVEQTVWPLLERDNSVQFRSEHNVVRDIPTNIKYQATQKPGNVVSKEVVTAIELWIGCTGIDWSSNSGISEKTWIVSW